MFQSVEALERDIRERGRARVPPTPAAWHAAEWFDPPADEASRAARDQAVTAVLREASHPDELGCALVIGAQGHGPFVDAALDRLDKGLPEHEPLPGKSLETLALEALVGLVTFEDALRLDRSQHALRARGRADLRLHLMTLGGSPVEVIEALEQAVSRDPSRVSVSLVSLATRRVAREGPERLPELAGAVAPLPPQHHQRFLKTAAKAAEDWVGGHPGALEAALRQSPPGEPTHTLYASQPPRRFFLIPDDAELPEGELQLTSLTGRSLRVDPDVAGIWGVEEDEAQRWGAERLRGFGSALADALRAAPRAAPSEADVARTAERRAGLAARLGISEAQLREDPEAVRAGILAGLSRFKGELEELAAATRVEDATIHQRAERLAQEADAQGMPELAQATRSAPEALRGVLGDPELVGKLREASAKLREASAQLRAERLARRGKDGGEA